MLNDHSNHFPPSELFICSRTHGLVEKKTQSGRVAEQWIGVMAEVERRMSESCRNLVNRDGRFDLRLPEFVVQALKLDEALAPVLEKLRSVMGQPRPEIRTHNVVFVPVGSEAQGWHADDSMYQGKKYRYFTILVHLNTTENKCGGTEIWSKQQQLGDLIRGRPGDAFVFNGSMLHRGQANNGSMHRFFYYASFACRPDANTVEYD